jgi:hypothetical protein
LSTSIEPPADYWASLAGVAAPEEIAKLRALSQERLNELTSDSSDVALLERLVADGWLRHEQRFRCPNPDCDRVLTAEEAADAVCPNCNEPYERRGGVIEETIFVRDLVPTRVVDWVIAIHGMNSPGAWQEAFSWLLGTTWGRSVPVAVYKYGIVIPGVIMPWRRVTLRNELREKLARLRNEARGQGFSGNPDVVAHSFGTWLFGHILEEELKRAPETRLTFGRIILAGCVLRPDFDWKRFKDEGLVEDVLNHYGTKDVVVPLAHAAIYDSGPSGRRGFDGNEVLNIRAEGSGHSDLFVIDKFVDGDTHLEHSYKNYWRPFLTLPRNELNQLPDRVDPKEPWRPLPWPLRGTLFPLFVLPLLVALIALLVMAAGAGIAKVSPALEIVAAYGLGGLACLLAGTAVVKLARWLARLTR